MQSASPWHHDPLLTPPTQSKIARPPELRAQGCDLRCDHARRERGHRSRRSPCHGLGVPSAPSPGRHRARRRPHVFGTFTATFADKDFRRRNPWLIASSLLILSGRLAHHSQLSGALVGLIVAASLHVLHQCAYLTDCYRMKARTQERPWPGSSTTVSSFHRSTPSRSTRSCTARST